MGEEKAKSLFPILGQPEETLTGMARLAASGEDAGEGHQIRFHTLPVHSALNRSVSKRGHWFARSLNPYRGCEFACRYCYARYTHEFLNFNDPAAFEHEIYLKQNLAWLLRQELRKLHTDEEIAIGTATDPYQPVERTARITRSLLEVLAEESGRRIGIVTKSTLIERDVDLLQAIARRNILTIHITITTVDRALARKLEPRAPRPDLRFQTVERLRSAELIAGVLCSPLLPGITDNERALSAVAKAAARAGASFFAASPVFLKPCSRATFQSFIQEHFPKLARDYEVRFRNSAFTGPAYNAHIRTLVEKVASRHSLRHRGSDAILTEQLKGVEEPPKRGPAQYSLFAEARRA